MTTSGQDTYGRLLAALRPGLLRFARIQLRDPAQAEDIVQETLAAAWGKLGQFREEADLKTWVTAILKNKIADHFRSGRRTAVSLDSLREENEAARASACSTAKINLQHAQTARIQNREQLVQQYQNNVNQYCN